MLYFTGEVVEDYDDLEEEEDDVDDEVHSSLSACGVMQCLM